jgi:hypothetical protein
MPDRMQAIEYQMEIRINARKSAREKSRIDARKDAREKCQNIRQIECQSRMSE